MFYEVYIFVEVNAGPSTFCKKRGSCNEVMIYEANYRKLKLPERSFQFYNHGLKYDEYLYLDYIRQNFLTT